MAPRILIKATLIALILSVFSIEAFAISRYNSKSLSCSNIQSKVRAQGAILLRWPSKGNPSVPLGGRFVRSTGYCDINQRAETTYVPSSDRKSCRLKKCKKYDPILRFRRR